LNKRSIKRNKASPQLENGYTQIANEILEALARVNIGYGNARILYAVLRKTYGWSKKEDKISISQFEEITGLSRRMVIYSIQNLEAKKILIVKRKRGRGNVNEINEISFNKNYEEWVVQRKSKQYQKALNNMKIQYLKSKNRVVQRNGGSAMKHQKQSIHCTHKRNKEKNITTQKTLNSPKEKQQRAKIEYADNGDIVYPPLFEKFWEYYPRKKEKIPTLEAWLGLGNGKGNMEDVVRASKNYRDEQTRLGTAENFIKLPPTFLHKDRWKDYLVSHEELQREALRRELRLKETGQ